MNQQRGCEHLADGDNVARQRPARLFQREKNRKNSDDASDENSRPHMRVNMTLRANPRFRRNPNRRGDSGQPLKDHKVSKHPIRSLVDRLLMLAKKSIRALLRGERELVEMI